MVTSRELISVCRQIGGMMEAGVDILRITRVLRSQTQNARLLDLYDNIDHELTMGRGLADVLARASDIFSPFAISLVRQGEERNNLAVAFLRLADFLEKEETQYGAATPSTSATNSSATSNSQPFPTLAEDPFSAANVFQTGIQDATLKVLWSRGVRLVCAWMLTIAFVLFLHAMGEFESRLRAPLCLLLCAIIGLGATWYWNRNDAVPIVAANREAPAQLTEFFATEPQISSAQSTLTGNAASNWDDVTDANDANAWEQPSRFAQSTLNRADARETVNRDENVRDGTETDASEMLGRLKQRAPRHADEEEAFD